MALNVDEVLQIFRGNHYDGWICRRCMFIEDKVDLSRINGYKILDLGAGHGANGMWFK